MKRTKPSTWRDLERVRSLSARMQSEFEEYPRTYWLSARNSTAMRAATPQETWAMIRLSLESSATSPSISTPRLTGPGCKMGAPVRIRLRRASVRP